MQNPLVSKQNLKNSKASNLPFIICQISIIHMCIFCILCIFCMCTLLRYVGYSLPEYIGTCCPNTQNILFEHPVRRRAGATRGATIDGVSTTCSGCSNNMRRVFQQHGLGVCTTPYGYSYNMQA